MMIYILGVDGMDYLIIFCIIGLPCILLIRFCVKSNMETSEKKEQYKADIFCTFKHVEGLPLANGVDVEIYYSSEKITFLKEKQEISLLVSKIQSIDVVTGKDLKNQISSGAIAGKYIIGGTTGALIGAALSTTLYFVITYKSEDEYKFLILDTAYSTTYAYKIKKDFDMNNDNAETESIEL